MSFDSLIPFGAELSVCLGVVLVLYVSDFRGRAMPVAKLTHS